MAVRPLAGMTGDGVATLELRRTHQSTCARVLNGAQQVLVEGTTVARHARMSTVHARRVQRRGSCTGGAAPRETPAFYMIMSACGRPPAPAGAAGRGVTTIWGMHSPSRLGDHRGATRVMNMSAVHFVDGAGARGAQRHTRSVP